MDILRSQLLNRLLQDVEVVIEAPRGMDRVEAFQKGVEYLAQCLGLGEHWDTAKAVAPHRSQFQTRGAGGRFRQPRYVQTKTGVERTHHSEFQPRGLQGKFMRRLDDAEQAEAAAQASRYVNELGPRLSRHLSDYELGRITSKEWHNRCGEDINHYYELCYREGKRAAGDPAVRLSATDRAILNRLVKDELDYLRGFGDDMDAGRGRMAYHRRMSLYGTAAREAFWVGWVTGDQRPAREVRWRLGNTIEHCTDCADFDGRDWMQAREFYLQILSRGFTPQSGMLECQGHNCQCYLQERLNGGKPRRPPLEV